MEKDWNTLKPTPLPKDGEQVEWTNAKGETKQGFFSDDEADGVFCVPDPNDPNGGTENFDFGFDVEKWRPKP